MSAQRENCRFIDRFIIGAICDIEDPCERLRAVRNMISSGASVDKKHRISQQTALHLAVKNNDDALLDFLVQAGADLNIQDSDGNQALHLAVVQNKLHAATVLIEHGGNLASIWGDLVELAAQHIDLKMMELLFRFWIPGCLNLDRVLAIVSIRNDLNLLELLLRQLDAVSVARDIFRELTMHLMIVRYKNPRVVLYLIDQGVNIYYNMPVPADMRNALLREMAFQASNRKHVHPNRLRIIDVFDKNKVYDVYLQELTSMKTMEVSVESEVTWFDLLNLQGDALDRCFRSKNVRHTYDQLEHLHPLPGWIPMLKRNADEQRNRWLHMDVQDSIFEIFCLRVAFVAAGDISKFFSHSEALEHMKLGHLCDV